MRNTQHPETKQNSRRGFFHSLGAATAVLTAAAQSKVHAQSGLYQFQFDSPTQILTAALIAEDLATTFYYNSLVGKAADDPVFQNDPGDKNYLRAALSEEIAHANLLRSLLNIPAAANDPVQTFYFPKGTFDTLNPESGAGVVPTLEALENAFIGAYLTAVRAFSFMAANTAMGRGVYYKLGNSNLSPDQLAYFSQVAASILGVEAEHRALVRVIGSKEPANNVCYQQTAGLDSVFSGPKSAVVALTPFLTPTTGPAYSFKEALDGSAAIALPCEFGPPAP
ncbi:MAG TPA: ferritin-like domain-containing protein [Bryobacteraceae bacterium]|nr:ferritin-like domain-containing protein [Bryobacteraceae bacterium]